MSRGGKIGLGIGITAGILPIAVLLGLIVSGYLYAFGPFGFMADKIHPTQAGYLRWWTPKMEEYLNAFMTNVAA